MAYCGPRGIPLSQFLGWSEHDQAAALAWQSHEAARCPHCGTHPQEWRDDPHAYTAQPRGCLGCHLLGTASREHARGRGGKEPAPGQYFTLVPKR